MFGSNDRIDLLGNADLVEKADLKNGSQLFLEIAVVIVFAVRITGMRQIVAGVLYG
ncbi:MAG TPA: hypothetical protein VN939_02195 [Chthoniobacterales bacterium]|nr:hypothetical protein [Chthoniobacterales bacterium]